MKRQDEIKVLIEYLITKLSKTIGNINTCNNLNSRMSDHLKEVKALCTNIEELRKEYDVLINTK